MQPANPPPPLELRLEAVPQSVPRARRLAAEYAERAGAEPAEVELAVAEAVANSVLHGYRDRSPGTVVLHAALESDGLVVLIADDGNGMQPHPRGGGLGLGLALIGQLTKSFTVSEAEAGGMRLRMTFPLLGRSAVNV